MWIRARVKKKQISNSYQQRMSRSNQQSLICSRTRLELFHCEFSDQMERRHSSKLRTTLESLAAQLWLFMSVASACMQMGGLCSRWCFAALTQRSDRWKEFKKLCWMLLGKKPNVVQPQAKILVCIFEPNPCSLLLKIDISPVQRLQGYKNKTCCS